MGFKDYSEEHKRKIKEGLLCSKCGANPPKEGGKICVKCLKWLSKYNKKAKVIKCRNESRRKSKIRNPERWKIKQLRADLKKGYGLTIEKFKELEESQNGVCAICFRSQKGRLGVDHNHYTQKIRGLLCSKCNTALGLLDESIDRIYSMINYLKRFQGGEGGKA